MKMLRLKINLLIALALANGFFAAAQSNNSASTDYSSYSQVITERNIFDPSRYPRTRTSGRRPPRSRPRPLTAGAPEFSFVGTMNYGKGLFAFFSGNNSDLKKILEQDGSIAGYTVTEITPTQVKLQTEDKKNVTLKVGDLMRQESGHWDLVGQGEVSAETSVAAPVATGESTSPATAESPASPVGADSAANEILKRLMQRREQDSK